MRVKLDFYSAMVLQLLDVQIGGQKWQNLLVYLVFCETLWLSF